MGTIGLIVGSVVLSAAAQVSLKAGMSSPTAQGAISIGFGVQTIPMILSQPMIGLGLILYFASAAIWLGVLARMELSSAYPFVALGIVLTSLCGWIFFDDAFGTAKIVGTILIVSGVATLAYNV